MTNLDPKKRQKVEQLLKKNKAQTDPLGALADEVFSMSEKLDKILEKLNSIV